MYSYGLPPFEAGGRLTLGQGNGSSWLRRLRRPPHAACGIAGTDGTVRGTSRGRLMRRSTLFAFVPFLLASPVAGAEPVQVPVFEAGKGGYHTYRIPSVIVTPKGTLLAFCE